MNTPAPSAQPFARRQARSWRRLTAVSTAFAVGAAGVLAVMVGSSGAELGPDHVDNTGFRKGLHSWDRTVAGQRLDRVEPGYDGSLYAARLRTIDGPGSVVLDDEPNTVRDVGQSQTYVARAFVRTTEPNVTASLAVRELNAGRSVGGDVDRTLLRDRQWQELRVRYTTVSSGSALDLKVRGVDLRAGQDLLVDRVTIRKVMEKTRDVTSTGSGLPPVCGTWVLQQASSAAELDRMRADLRAALAKPGVRGLSVRAPWNAVDGNLALFNEALQIARAAGKPLSIRVMAGRFTPNRVFNAGAYSYVDSRGQRIPKPFSDSGQAGNPVFEREYGEMVSDLAAWSRGNGVTLLHLPWYGHMWAEIDNGVEIQRARGYSEGAWATGHKRLIDIGLRHAGNGLAVEFPMTGHWGDAGALAVAFQDHIVASAGRFSPKIFLQANGLGVFNGNPAGSRPIYTGQQMYDGGQYRWASIFSHAKSTRSTYVEVYTTSFKGSGAEALVAEIERFRSVFDSSCHYR